MRKLTRVFSAVLIVLGWSLSAGISGDGSVVVSSVLDTFVQPPFEFLQAPLLVVDGVRVQGRAGGTCVHGGKTHNDQEEWAHYTTSQATKPYYGFKLKCQDGTVQVLGCYENDMVIAVDGKETSKAYDGFDILCSATGFKYERAAKSCKDHALGETWNQGFYKYECTKDGIVIRACLDLDQKERAVGEVYTVLNAYRMQCIKKPDGKLVVEAIACIDENGQIIKLNGETRSPWYVRTCQETRTAGGRQTEVALNLTQCCEATTDHCIPVNSREPSVLFPELTFACIKRDKEFTYRYFGKSGAEVTIDESDLFSTTPQNETTHMNTTVAETTLAVTTSATPMPSTETQHSPTTTESLVTTQETIADTVSSSTEKVLSTPSTTAMPEEQSTMAETETPMPDTTEETQNTMTLTTEKPTEVFATEQPLETLEDTTLMTMTATNTETDMPTVTNSAATMEAIDDAFASTSPVTSSNSPMPETDEAVTVIATSTVKKKPVAVTKTRTTTNKKQQRTTRPTTTPSNEFSTESTDTSQEPMTAPPWPPKPAPTDEMVENVEADFTEPNDALEPSSSTASPQFSEQTDAPDRPPNRPKTTPKKPVRQELASVATTTEQPWNKWSGPQDRPNQQNPNVEPAENPWNVVTHPDRFPDNNQPDEVPDRVPQKPGRPSNSDEDPWGPNPDDQVPPRQPETDNRPANRPDNPWWQPDANNEPDKRPQPNPSRPNPDDNIQPPPRQPETMPGHRPDNPMGQPDTNNGPDKRPQPNPSRPNPDDNIQPPPRQPETMPGHRPDNPLGQPDTNNGPDKRPQPNPSRPNPDDNIQPPPRQPETMPGHRPDNNQPPPQPETANRPANRPDNPWWQPDKNPEPDGEAVPERPNPDNNHQQPPRQPDSGTRPGQRPNNPGLQPDTNNLPGQRPGPNEGPPPTRLPNAGTDRPPNPNPNEPPTETKPKPHKELGPDEPWVETGNRPASKRPQNPNQNVDGPDTTNRKPDENGKPTKPLNGGNNPTNGRPNDEHCIAQKECPPKWTRNGNHCYYFAAARQRRNVERAEETCLRDNGHLLLLNDDTEWNYMKDELNALKRSYPGKGYDGFWVGYRYDEPTGQWHWDLRSEFSPIPWLDTKLRSTAGRRRRRRRRQAPRDLESHLRSCGDIRWQSAEPGHWGMDNDHCQHRQWFICELCLADPDKQQQQQQIPPKEGIDGAKTPVGGNQLPNVLPGVENCRDGWTEYNRHCYFLSNPNNRVGVDDAKQVCANHGAQLVVINDQGEWDFIANQAEKQRFLQPDESFDGYWIGLSLNSGSQQWEWATKSSFNNIPWLPETDNRHKRQATEYSQACGEIRHDLTQWGADKDHCLHLQGYICEKGLGDDPNGDCRLWKNKCGSMTQCIETQSGYRCACAAGYEDRGDGRCVDIDECRDPVKACGPNAHCQNDQGSHRCYCKMHYRRATPSDDCLEFATCTTYGDPHYRGFDGSKLLYQGLCRTVLVESKSAAMGSFRIDSRAEIRDNIPGYSWTRDMFFRAFGREIGLLKGGKVSADGQPATLPIQLENGRIAVKRSAQGHLLVQTDFGVEVTFDGENRGEIMLDARHKRQVSGVCGNYNGDVRDDNRTPDGSVMDDPDRFGDSWRAPEDKNNPNCSPHSSQPSGARQSDPCNPGSSGYIRAEQFCRPLNSANGPFSECYQMVGIDSTNYFRSCIIDVCGTGPKAMCAEFENVAGQCAERGIPVTGWRAKLGCSPKSCGENQEYLTCGPSCPKSCADLFERPRQNCPDQCVEGCFCKKGFVLSGDACVPENACGCMVNNRYLSIGQFYYKDDTCKQKCTCVQSKDGQPASQDCSFQECDYQAICMKQGETNMCSCRSGFQSEGNKCIDIDECATGAGRSCQGPNQQCVNTLGSYQCKCDQGYRLQPDDNNHKRCTDIDECFELGTRACQDTLAECQNTPGSFRCACPKGYMMKDGANGRRAVRAVDGTRCEDIDECSMNTHNCDSKSACRNTPGSFSCSCQPGMTNTNNAGCQRAAICTPSSGCHANSDCVTVSDRTKCSCRAGFEGDGVNNCQDIDECADPKTNPCDSKNSKCLNTVGSVECRCAVGFRAVDGVHCEDVNECSEGACGQNAECLNTYGSYKCRCLPGFERHGDTCDEINECLTPELNRCDRSAECKNSYGSYSCHCMQGFTGNGYKCTAFDSCETCHNGDGGCDRNARCYSDLSTAKGFRCVCNPGYTGDGFTCQDLNECQQLRARCAEGTTCVNTQGGYHCECQEDDGQWVIADTADRCRRPVTDPCKDTKNPVCDKSATCESKGSLYRCHCAKGFTGDGKPKHCKDIDECKTGTEKICGANSICHNTQGSYWCECKQGYVKPNARLACEDLDECKDETLNKCDRQATCINIEGSYNCQCKKGFKGDGKVCKRTDACARLRKLCDKNAECADLGTETLCRCRPGFTGDGFSCQDIDECADIQMASLCGRESKCVNTPGSFKCECNLGFKRINANTCEDIDECATECKDATMDCKNTYGSFSCLCKMGYRLTDPEQSGEKICVDIDDCSEACRNGKCKPSDSNPLCPVGTRCVNRVGGVECACNEDLKKNAGLSCKQVDECATGKHNCNGPHMSCVDTSTGFHCQCADGYSFARGMDEPICVDNDECSRPNNCSLHASCTNLPGSYSCACRPGFTGDGFSCTDMDECTSNMMRRKRQVTTNNRACHEDAICSNTLGSFFCKCGSGFSGDGYASCTKTNQCVQPDVACAINAVCVETNGTFECHCRPGFSGNVATGCLDIDECASTKLNKCNSKQSTCVNNNGSYRCNCKPGYRSNANTNTCDDIDECSERTHNCSGQINHCINTDGSFKCGCSTGFELKNGVCKDIDECLTESCQNKTTCVNSMGSYHCGCERGYRNDENDDCVDINECLEGLVNCGSDVPCANTPGSFVCRCPNGFLWNDTGCADIDECAATVQQCPSDAKCKNTIGSFLCKCPDGKIRDGTSKCRKSKQTCREESGRCDQFANCTDVTGGSIHCQCRVGFEGDGFTCTDVNECESGGTSICQQDAECFNTIGSYSCKCLDGFVLVTDESGQANCQDYDECATVRCPTNEICRNKIGGYECTCGQGFKRNKQNACIDVDECQTGANKCAENAVCSNTFGSYQCKCAIGFEGDGHIRCNDVDECTTKGQNNCRKDQVCSNTVGSYACECRQGFARNENTGLCSETDVCSKEEQNGCHPTLGECKMEAGRKFCRCKPGYAGDGVTCADIDECRLGLDVCSNEAACENTPGSYLCQCLSGYAMTADGKCKDIDECVERKGGECDANAECKNLPGTYACRCKQCYSGDGFTCRRDPCCDCHHDAVCLKGSCKCKSGFIGNGHNCSASCKSNKCARNAECIADPTADMGYICRCPKDQSGDGFTCQKKVVDTCGRLQVDCGNGTCLSGAADTDDYTCVCSQGFSFQNGSCHDVDECISGDERLCAKPWLCRNTFGSHECRCENENEVWNPTAKECQKAEVDMADCSIGQKICARKNAECSNVKDVGYECKCRKGSKQNADGVCFDQVQLEEKRPKRSADGVICPQGYHFNSTAATCTDKNECETGENDCPPNSKCKNLDGGFACNCLAGFKLAKDGNSCQDIDECANSTACTGTNGTCINTVGSFHCQCPAHAALMGDFCQIVDSEKLCAVLCGEHGSCRQIGGNWNCLCQDGFVRERQSGPSFISKCIDIDECAIGIDSCHSLALCNNTVGSYSCQCRPPSIGDGRSCELTNPCESIKPCSVHANCKPLGGADYDCECAPGFLGDGKRCDPDPCLVTPNGGCPLTSSCLPDISQQNSTTSCICYDGYLGSLCEDVDECKGNHSCAINATCVNLPGSYSCACPVGFTGDGRSQCADIDECSGPNKVCGMHSHCHNSIGSFNCSCLPGYVGNGFFCEPDLKCEGGCAQNAQCRTTADQSACQCLPGFNSTNPSIIDCEDIDECLLSNICPPNSKCSNTNGSFHCECSSGFEQNDDVCVDVDECHSGIADCAHYERCENTVGSYRCMCNAGFAHINGSCVDIDECNTTTLCDDNARCFNFPGDFRCKCNAGFTGSGFFCFDVDECATNKSSCTGPNEHCVNVPGHFDCLCDRGYEKIGDNCKDIDECNNSAPNGCPNTTICLNTPGSFACECVQGYTGSSDYCAAIDPCSTMKCGLNARCVSDIDSSHQPTCQCNPEYIGDGRNCSAKPMCKNHTCSDEEECIPLRSGFFCKCKDGFARVEGHCHDVDECLNNMHMCDPGRSTCLNTKGSYHCQCKNGFQHDSRKRKCIDVDECTAGLANCGHALDCHNFEGGYRCDCNSGMRFNIASGACEAYPECRPDSDSSCMAHAECIALIDLNTTSCMCRSGYQKSADQQRCIDFDECGMDKTMCHPLALCLNVIGSYECRCLPGYFGDGIDCTDVDECDSEASPCAADAICVNTDGSFQCVCSHGFYGDGYRCQRLLAENTTEHENSIAGFARKARHDLCNSIDHPCGANAECVAGGQLSNDSVRVCVCKIGYWGNPFQECIDVDECRMDYGRCGPNADCSNTEGSFECKCHHGFQLNEQNICGDIDECSKSSVCPLNAVCMNTYGSHQCRCQSGYRTVSGQCADIDECLEEVDNCHPMAQCENTAGAFKCQCITGYEGDGKSECTEKSACSDFPCDPNSVCQTEGMNTFRCVCNAGFHSKNGICEDIDECSSGAAMCSSNAHCQNTVGSYFCRCDIGYTGDGFVCQDMDECHIRGVCSANEICENSFGSFSCKCLPGFVQHNGTCVDIDECGDAWQLCGVHKCINTDGGYYCQCSSGYQRDYSTGHCTDIDECLHQPCGDHGVCFNSAGNYKCVCKSGFQLKNGTCSDIDECEAKIGPCLHASSKCINSLGSFYCMCGAGYYSIDRSCTDINECHEAVGSHFRHTCHSDAMCFNTEGAFSCVCKSGFTGDGFRCDDINECQQTTNLCGEVSECVNFHGGYTCRCKAGFKSDGNRGCTDVDECATRGACPDGALCANTVGSFVCSCPDGMQKSKDGCQDVDECEKNACSQIENSTCQNTIGSYQCKCHIGYERKGNECIDKNECLQSPCSGLGASCLNTEGSYRCQCSHGFVQVGTQCREMCTTETCGPQKKCRVSADMHSVECVCDVAEQIAGRVNQPLCTTRRQYFDSLTAMVYDACARNITHDIDYYGPCRATCESQSGKVICQTGLRCILNPVTQLPTCTP